jgi:hypothetical protein
MLCRGCRAWKTFGWPQHMADAVVDGTSRCFDRHLGSMPLRQLASLPQMGPWGGGSPVHASQTFRLTSKLRRRYQTCPRLISTSRQDSTMDQPITRTLGASPGPSGRPHYTVPIPIPWLGARALPPARKERNGPLGPKPRQAAHRTGRVEHWYPSPLLARGWAVLSAVSRWTRSRVRRYCCSSRIIPGAPARPG